jgi:hypothetical protein
MAFAMTSPRPVDVSDYFFIEPLKEGFRIQWLLPSAFDNTQLRVFDH